MAEKIFTGAFFFFEKKKNQKEATLHSLLGLFAMDPFSFGEDKGEIDGEGLAREIKE